MASSYHPWNHCFTSLVYTISFQPALICAGTFKETISAVEGGANYNNTSLWGQEEPTSLIAVLKAWVCANNVEVMKNCSFCMNPGLCIPQSLCLCVTQVSPPFTSPSLLYTLCTAGQMCPGREPHGNNKKPHQKSSTKRNMIMNLHSMTTRHPSIPAFFAAWGEDQLVFVFVFLNTSWSLADLSFLVSLYLFIYLFF